MIKAYTDYPLFKDEEGKEAPIREIEVGVYDEDKYVEIYFNGEKFPSIKRGYIYSIPGRCGGVKQIDEQVLLHNNFMIDRWKDLEKGWLKDV